MKHKSLYMLFMLVLVISMLLAACQPQVSQPIVTEEVQPAQPIATVEEPTAVPPTEEVAAEPTATTEVAAEPTATVPPYATMKTEAPNCDYGGTLKSIESLDEFTVKFTFCAPEPAFLPKISSVEAFDIYDADYIKEIGGDAVKLNDNPVGTGPYIVQEWVRGDHVTLVPNPNYFGEKPVNTTLIFKWNKESAARLLDLQSGNTSGISEVTADDIPQIQADPNLTLYPRKVNNFLYLGINNTKPPFDNEQVRQAFAMAIDKQRIVDDFYAPGSVAATQFVPPGVKPGFTDGYVGTTYNPEKAKQMLTDAGFDFNAEYVLSYAERTRPYFPQPTKIAQAVQAQLAEIGIKIKLEMEEWATYLPATRNGEKTLFFLGWSEDYPDATNWYDVFLTGSSKSFGDAFPDMVELIKKAATLSDAAERQKIYDQVNVLYDQHVPTIVIAHGTTNLAFLASVENVVLGPYNENFRQMKTADGTVVFSQDGEPVSLYCADETDGNSFRVCKEIFSKLYDFEFGTANYKPELAEACTGNADATEWTCTLKKGIKFSNGAALDANDVVTSFTIGWDATNPLRKGNSGAFQYFKDFFGPKALNEPPSQ
jgi:peptide/nickel transport system substrate-binding protein